MKFEYGDLLYDKKFKEEFVYSEADDFVLKAEPERFELKKEISE